MWWFSTSDPNPIPREPKDKHNHGKNNPARKTGQDLSSNLATSLNSPLPIAIVSFSIGCVFGLTFPRVHRRYWKRIPNADWITPDIIEQKRWLKGVVVKVGDGDGFRLYHTPGIFWTWPFKFRSIPKKIRSGETISIRMAGGDAPENGHWGNPTQPYAKESIKWLERQVLGKKVYCQVGLRDHHGRIVAMPMIFPRFVPRFLSKGKCVSMELLRKGYGVTYEGVGEWYGEYTKGDFRRLEEQAKAARRGMWIDGSESVEKPSEYKRRYGRPTNDAEAAGRS